MLLELGAWGPSRKVTERTCQGGVTLGERAQVQTGSRVQEFHSVGGGWSGEINLLFSGGT